MAPQTLVRRVESLESRVAVLEQLPEKLDAIALQISQMREEIRGEFSALRTEVRAGDEETRRVLRAEMHTEFSALRDEIRAGDEESRRHARMLHEDMISRLALTEEGGRRQRQRPDTTGERSTRAPRKKG